MIDSKRHTTAEIESQKPNHGRQIAPGVEYGPSRLLQLDKGTDNRSDDLHEAALATGRVFKRNLEIYNLFNRSLNDRLFFESISKVSEFESGDAFLKYFDEIIDDPMERIRDMLAKGLVEQENTPQPTGDDPGDGQMNPNLLYRIH